MIKLRLHKLIKLNLNYCVLLQDLTVSNLNLHITNTTHIAI